MNLETPVRCRSKNMKLQWRGKRSSAEAQNNRAVTNPLFTTCWLWCDALFCLLVWKWFVGRLCIVCPVAVLSSLQYCLWMSAVESVQLKRSPDNNNNTFNHWFRHAARSVNELRPWGTFIEYCVVLRSWIIVCIWSLGSDALIRGVLVSVRCVMRVWIGHSTASLEAVTCDLLESVLSLICSLCRIMHVAI